MSHRSRRSDDRDWPHSSGHSSHKYDKHDYRHRRDDSRDRSEHYHSRDRSDNHHSSSRSDKNRSKYRSRSRSPSYGSKSHSRHHRSRSRSHGHSSKHYDDYHSRSHRYKDHKEIPDSRSRRDSNEHSQTNNSAASHDKVDASSSSKNQLTNQTNEWGSTSISSSSSSTYQNHNNYDTYDETKTNSAAISEEDAELEEEKQRIQRATLERLQKHLEKEGKAYPPPKPQASHPIFANDGSFLEMFKSMQGNLQQQQQQQQQLLQQQFIVEPQPKPVAPTVAPTTSVTRLLPVKRRGAKILKTGIVQKQRVVEEAEEPAQTSDSWNAYLKEVKRYKTVTCSDDSITRSLVK